MTVSDDVSKLDAAVNCLPAQVPVMTVQLKSSALSHHQAKPLQPAFSNPCRGLTTPALLLSQNNDGLDH